MPAPGAARRRDLRASRRGARRAPAGSRQPGRAAQGGGRRLDGAGRSGPDRRRGARGAIPGSRGVALRAARGRVAARLAGPGPAVVRLQLVRRRLPLAGRHQPRPPHPPPEPRRHRGPRDLPRPPPRARGEGAAAGRGARPPRVLDPADQRPGMPHLGGAGQPRRRDRGAARGAARAADGDGDDRGAADGRRSRGAARGRRSPCRHRRATGDPRRGAGQRRAHAPRRRRVSRLGRGLPGRGRPEQPGDGGQAARVHLAPAVAPVRLRLHRGRGDAPAVARGGPAGRARREVRPPADRVAHATCDPRRDGGGAGGARIVTELGARPAGSRSIRAASRTGSRRAARCDTSS